ncbi:hypothetical protein ARMGADRAFT_1038908 [Armillaria gallica]|uniref:Uncharacterized protein n=1 Tax=Armillaria gallica TaxID=47427 RepID=A0A2H3CKZ8_ARMGA|nr:hypothetical protein ARMGADRAFT_1038908 [Armillaria gallica]
MDEFYCATSDKGLLSSLSMRFFYHIDKIDGRDGGYDGGDADNYGDEVWVSLGMMSSGLFGVKVKETAAVGKRLLTIYKLTERDTASPLFIPAGAGQISVAQSYMQANQMSSKYYLHAEKCSSSTTKGAVMPLEQCYIIPSRLSQTELNLGATQFMVEFTTKGPTSDWVLTYGQFQYARDFGLEIKTSSLPAAEYCHAYMGYKHGMEKVLTLPKLLIFSRDGVSEGEFKHILDSELLLLQDKSTSINHVHCYHQLGSVTLHIENGMAYYPYHKQ